MKFETLYKRSLDGVEIWKIEIDNDTIITTWGKYNGKQQTRKTIIKEGKNIGKQNETSIHLQAKNEAASKWNKKVDREGYYSTRMLGYKNELMEVDKIQGFYYFPVNGEANDNSILTLTEVLKRLPEIGTTNSGETLPMLAKSFYRETKNGNVPRLQFPMLIQPKFNGVRCLLKVNTGIVTFWSRTGVEYSVPPLKEMIEADIMRLYKWVDGINTWINPTTSVDEIILDGELYIHETILADIVSAVKKPNLHTHLLRFYCYDIAHSYIVQYDRLKALKSLNLDGVVIVHTMKLRDDSTTESMLEQYIESGFEGLIGRNPSGYYQFGARSADLVKLKKGITEEFEIIDVYDTNKQPGLAMFKCKNNINDEYFEVVPEGTHELRRQYMEDRVNIIGKPCTVFFYERTDKPKEVPFHAKGVAIRDYE